MKKLIFSMLLAVSLNSAANTCEIIVTSQVKDSGEIRLRVNEMYYRCQSAFITQVTYDVNTREMRVYHTQTYEWQNELRVYRHHALVSEPYRTVKAGGTGINNPIIVPDLDRDVYDIFILTEYDYERHGIRQQGEISGPISTINLW